MRWLPALRVNVFVCVSLCVFGFECVAVFFCFVLPCISCALTLQGQRVLCCLCGAMVLDVAKYMWCLNYFELYITEMHQTDSVCAVHTMQYSGRTTLWIKCKQIPFSILYIYKIKCWAQSIYTENGDAVFASQISYSNIVWAKHTLPLRHIHGQCTAKLAHWHRCSRPHPSSCSSIISNSIRETMKHQYSDTQTEITTVVRYVVLRVCHIQKGNFRYSSPRMRMTCNGIEICIVHESVSSISW